MRYEVVNSYPGNMMPTRDLISIILPTLNGARYIRQSIESCLGQTHQELELILVDGGSTDGARDIVREFRDPRLVLLDQQANEGRISGALNIGLARMSGSFWTWMQDDSYYAPRAMELMLQRLHEDPTADMVYTDYWRLDENDQLMGLVQVGSSDELVKWDLLGVCFLYRRHVYESVGTYDLRHWLVQDYEYRLRVKQRCRMVPYHEPLYFYRLHPGSLTGRFGLDVERASIEMKLDRGYWDSGTARKALSDLEIAKGFLAYGTGDLLEARHHFLVGLAANPLHARNLGILSIVAESFLGTGYANRLRGLLRRLGLGHASPCPREESARHAQ